MGVVWFEPSSLAWMNAFVAGLAAVDGLVLASLLAHHGWTWAMRRVRRGYYLPLEQAVLDALAAGRPLPAPRRPWERAWLGEILGVLRPLLAGAAEAITAALVERGYVDEWIRQSRSPFWWRRADAVRRLGLSGAAAALPALEAALDDRREEVRRQALRALVRLGRPEAAERAAARIAALPAGSVWVRNTLAVLAEGQPESVRALLRRPLSREVLKGCLETLGAVGYRRAEGDLLAWAGSEDPEVRVSAVRGLASLATPAAEAALLAALDDPDWRVRAAAARGLSAPLRGGEAAARLAQALSDPVWWVRRNAAFALSRFPEGEAALVEDLASSDRFVREMAWYALQRAGLPERRPAMVRAAASANPYPDLKGKMERALEEGAPARA